MEGINMKMTIETRGIDKLFYTWSIKQLNNFIRTSSNSRLVTKAKYYKKDKQKFLDLVKPKVVTHWSYDANGSPIEIEEES
tara:strand:+ start:259 stop:501 length:243 start_codon:yes stop_codon:yes gene_type:complete